jgi:hypothetical protein
MRRRTPAPGATPRKAYVLIAVLIVVTVLALAAYRFTDAMTSEYTVAARSAEAAQTKAFAASGVHYAMGMLADPSTFSGTLNSNPYDNPGAFSAQTVGSGTKRNGGRFSLISVGDTYTGSGESRYAVRYGVTDESAKLNLNSLMRLDPTGDTLYRALLNLPNMTADIGDAIVDYLDADDTARTAGAESSYYAGLSPPYQAKNGPLNSVDELLLVKGVTPQLLFGADRNRNGKLDPGEDAGTDFSRGWAEFLTVYGHELDTTFAGVPRIYLNDPDLDAATLYGQLTAALPQGMADYVMGARLFGTTAAPVATSLSVTGTMTTTVSGGTGTTTTTTRTTSSSPIQVTAASGGTGAGSKTTGKVATPAPVTDVGSSPKATAPTTVMGSMQDLNVAVTTALAASTPPQLKKQVKSMATLFNTQVALPKAAGAPATAPTVTVASPLGTPANVAAMLPAMVEFTTTRDPATDYDMTPRINAMTAPPEVLLGLPGLTQTEVDAIVAARAGLDPTDPAATTGAFMVTAGGLSPTKFAALAPYVTGKTMVYRVHSVGYFGRGGPAARVEAVIDTNGGTPRILYYRDVTDLGKGFDLPK